MVNHKRNTWAQVQAFLDAGARYGMAVACDDHGRLYLRDNNGWLLTRNPNVAMHGIQSMRETGGVVFRGYASCFTPAG